ncbi:MAG: Omp28-related outer membrane protein [Ignavibacteriae bacterium]|nr:Omp28-related outer membrane protein [Ignavibacteriota bacterium]
MKKFTIYALKCFALIAAIALIGNGIMNAQTPVKRVLVEEGTGAWCGWCPRGATTLVEMIEKYPGKVIGVAVHNADQMSVADESLFSQAFINGYPNMVVDRKRFAGISGAKIGMSDGAIPGPIATQLSQKAKVDVVVENLLYSSANRSLSVDVKASFVSSVTGDIRFNLYIVEDSVKGSGTGYDQANYLNTDNSSPWYNKGNPMKNFYHRHVLRKMLGAMWGTDKVIPSTVASGGVYTKNYTFTLPAGWNDKRISVVGLVEMYDANSNDKKEVLNAYELGLFETVLPLVAVTGSVADPYIHAPLSTTLTRKVQFKNDNDKDVEVNIEVDVPNSTLPGGWNATVEPTNATIPAGGTVDATVTITTDDQLDYAKAVVIAKPVVTDAIPVEGKATVYALSEDIKYCVIEGYNYFVKQPFTESMKAMKGVGDKTKVFTWAEDKEILQAFADQFNVCAISFSGGLILGGTADFVSGQPLAAEPTINPDYPNFAKYVKSIMAAGKHVLLSVPNGLWWNGQPGGVNEDATEFYKMLGIELGNAGQRFTVTTSGTTTTYTQTPFTVAGVDNEICANIMGSGNGGGGYYTYWTNLMKLSPGSASVPIFTISTKPSEIVGVRYEAANKARVVFLTFDMGAFNNDAISQQITEKAINWLAEGLVVKPKAPVIAGLNDLDFGEVELKKSKEMTVTIRNEGDADLMITAIKTVINNDFKLKSVSLPITIAPGDSIVVTVIYTPTMIGESIGGTLSITCNDPENTDILVDLVGSGKEAASAVFTPADDAKTIIGMTAGPNPATITSTISYRIGGVSPQVIEMYVVDVRGARVATLVDNLSLAPGSYTSTINAADLASGSYRIVAHSAVETVQLPLVINR